jgi:peptide/nickel transport system substrate-binding protein
VSWEPIVAVTLQRYADYWGEPHEWDEIRIIPILDDSAAEIALESGEVDWGSISPASVDRFEASDEFEVFSYVNLGYGWIAMNVQHPNLQDKNLREAIRYAIDADVVIEGAYEGKLERACSLIAPGQVGYWADAPCYERDVARAQEFLAQVPQVPELTLTLLNSEEWRAVGEIVQAQLAEVGIPVEIVAQDDSAFWDGGFGEAGLQDRQLTAISFANSPDPSWATVWFICDQVGQWNWMYWCDERYDELHFAALQELNTDTRSDMYIEMQQIWDAAAHTAWLYFGQDYVASRAGLTPGAMPHGWLLPYATTSE